MSYTSLSACVKDLDRSGQLLRIKSEVDPDLELAEIHRRIFDQQGPAILFENVKGSPFPVLTNLYGTFERTEWLFRKTLEQVQRITELKADPARMLKNPGRYWRSPFVALTGLPRKAWSNPVKYGKTTIDQLPLIKSWPMDGGAFVTMPQVLTLPPGSKKMMQSNIGMYRIQLSGNAYELNKEIGLHYQLHRGIGVHHRQYLESDEPFRCSVVVGGPPSFAFSAIMPLPEGLSELTFAGLLNGRAVRYGFDAQQQVLLAQADFVITGTIRKDKLMPEGPFGDHLGYYSLEHPFPVMEVENVYHRKDAIWHATVVGRPPQEDSSFGHLIHLLVKELTSGEFPGVKSINAVDAAGVHPLLLAVGSERYMPFRPEAAQGPEEIFIQANRILGSGQTSLAKFLFIGNSGDDPKLHADDIPGFFRYILERVDWTRDLHFQTRTTIDTLDYSGDGWNAGSKVIVAAAGAKKRQLATVLPSDFSLPEGYTEAAVALPGILMVSGRAFAPADAKKDMAQLAGHLSPALVDHFPLVVVCDDAAFAAKTLNNYLWVTYTRANPSHDIYGVDSFTDNKHWGCRGPLLIDARIKPHHAPELVVDETVSKRVDELFERDPELQNWK